MDHFIQTQKLLYKTKYVVAFFLMYTFAACDSFVEVDQPNSQLTSSAVFESQSTADAAMTDIYAQMRENGFCSGKLSGLSNLMGTYADDLISYESGSYSSADFYNNALLASNPTISSLWNATYNQIYAANVIYDGVNKSTALTESFKNQLQGEALFVRAFNHFYLVNIFGDIPYITSTDYKQNSTVTRMPTALVYEQIIADLELAINLLPDTYVGNYRVRPNKATAQALLARVYLYYGNWSQAIDKATSVINNSSMYAWEENLNNVFLKESTTTIWQLAPDYEGHNTDEGSAFIFFSGPPSLVSLSDELMAQFSNTDLRKELWTKAVSEGNSTWYHAYKYKEDADTAASLEYSIQFRLAEQYLIRAEARARANDLLGAVEDLNKIRNTAGLPNTTAINQSEILEAILQERRLEFFTEQGHRFFDLKRFEKLDSELSIKSGWNTTDNLWPLPQSELTANPFLRPQNPGY